jgi:uncharacterized protein YeaO (DUF488 family)
VYDEAAETDGLRVLVDRLWPRGVRKDDARIDLWIKDVAPSTELRTWYGHAPERWDEFCRRYREQLEALDRAGKLDELVKPLLARARRGPVTFLYAKKDTEHTHARVLKDFLEKRG